MKKYATLFHFVIITITGFIVYSNVIKGEFLWDDNLLIKDNQYIKSLSNTAKIFTNDIAAGAGNRFFFYRPLQIFSYAVDYAFWGLDVRGYHITNILLHIFVSMAVYWFAYILCNERTSALLTSVIFVLHPIHSGTVAYISGRADVLSALFMLLCVIFYRCCVPSKGIGMYIPIFFCYLFALLSKEYSMVLPLLIIIYQKSFESKVNHAYHALRGSGTGGGINPVRKLTQGINPCVRKNRNNPAAIRNVFSNGINYKIILSFIMPIGIYLALRNEAFERIGILSANRLGGIWQRIPGIFAALFNYLRLLIFPFGLHVGYGQEEFSFNDYRVIAGLLVSLIVLLTAIYRKRKGDQLTFFAIMWFFAALLPVSNLYSLNAYMAEHWLYLPSIGFFLVYAQGMRGILECRRYRVYGIISIMCLYFFYAYLTVRQNNYWNNPIAFYERTLKYVPQHSRFWINLGNEYHKRNIKHKAIEAYTKSIEINPHYSGAYNNLGNIYRESGRLNEAMDLYRKAIAMDDSYVKAYYNLGNLYADMGKYKEAVEFYRKVVIIFPEYAVAYNALAVAYYRDKQFKQAIAHLNRAAELGYDVNPHLSKELAPYQ